MTIPEISPLLLVSMCGLSVVCVGLFAVVAVLSVRFFAGDLWDTVTGMFERDDTSRRTATAQAQRPATERRDLRSRAQSLDFDPTGGGGNFNAQANPQKENRFGENTSLRPDSRPRFNEKKRDWNLAPPERMSDDPRNLNAPPPPDFSAGSEYLPNERSNIGGRVGRHNTGRGQTGQRMDSSRFSGRGNLRSDRNLRRDDEFFGGQADLDGDGDIDI